MQPRVKIILGNGNLGQTTQTDDGIVGLVLSGVGLADTTKVQADTPYQLFALSEAEDLGIKDGSTNEFAWDQIKSFYDQAGFAAELWLMITGSSLATIVDVNEEILTRLINESKGAVKAVGVAVEAKDGDTVNEGLFEDVHLAVPKAQALAAQYFERHYPFRIIIGGNNYSGSPADLKNYKEAAFNRVSVVLSNQDASHSADVGTLIGRIASIPVQRNIGRVKDAAVINVSAFFTDGLSVEDHALSAAAIHDKGYVFLKHYVGKAGYFYNDDPTLTSNSDDYNGLARGRVIDKATALAYLTFLEEILDEIPVSPEGQIHPALIKSWQANIANVINEQMTVDGEISGVKVYIDENQNILANSKIVINLSIQPVGYAKYIDVKLGFTTET